MAVVEQLLPLPEDRLAPPPTTGQLIALVDSLRTGTLNETQVAILQQLRAGILALTENEIRIQDVKVQTAAPEKA